MSIEDYGFLTIESGPWASISVSSFTRYSRDIYCFVDAKESVKYGIPQKTNPPIAGQNVLEDMDKELKCLEGNILVEEASPLTDPIQENLHEMGVISAGIHQSFEASTKVLKATNLIIAEKYEIMSRPFMEAKRAIDKNNMEITNLTCDRLLEQENIKEIQSLFPLVVDPIKEVKSICLKIQKLYEEKSKAVHLKQTDLHKSNLLVYIKYLCAKVLAVANSNNPTKEALEFVENYNRLMKEMKTEYNVHKAHLPKEDPTPTPAPTEPTVEENIQEIKVDVQDIKEELL